MAEQPGHFQFGQRHRHRGTAGEHLDGGGGLHRTPGPCRRIATHGLELDARMVEQGGAEAGARHHRGVREMQTSGQLAEPRQLGRVARPHRHAPIIGQGRRDLEQPVGIDIRPRQLQRTRAAHAVQLPVAPHRERIAVGAPSRRGAAIRQQARMQRGTRDARRAGRHGRVAHRHGNATLGQRPRRVGTREAGAEDGHIRQPRRHRRPLARVSAKEGMALAGPLIDAFNMETGAPQRRLYHAGGGIGGCRGTGPAQGGHRRAHFVAPHGGVPWRREAIQEPSVHAGAASFEIPQPFPDIAEEERQLHPPSGEPAPMPTRNAWRRHRGQLALRGEAGVTGGPAQVRRRHGGRLERDVMQTGVRPPQHPLGNDGEVGSKAKAQFAHREHAGAGAAFDEPRRRHEHPFRLGHAVAVAIDVTKRFRDRLAAIPTDAGRLHHAVRCHGASSRHHTAPRPASRPADCLWKWYLPPRAATMAGFAPAQDAQFKETA